MADLLPPNSSPFEHRLADVVARATDLDLGIRLVWDAQKAPMDFLPFLAWAESVDLWDDKWSEEDKRNVTDTSVDIHRHKGTPYAIRQALRAAGYGEVEIFEGLDAKYYDGSVTYGGTHFYSFYEHWAWFTVVLTEPVTIAQAQQIIRIINLSKRESMHLHELRYDEALHLYDGAILYDGSFTHGVINDQSI